MMNNIDIFIYQRGVSWSYTDVYFDSYYSLLLVLTSHQSEGNRGLGVIQSNSMAIGNYMDIRYKESHKGQKLCNKQEPKYRHLKQRVERMIFGMVAVDSTISTLRIRSISSISIEISIICIVEDL